MRSGFPPAPPDDPSAAFSAVPTATGLSGLPAIVLPGAEGMSLPGPPPLPGAPLPPPPAMAAAPAPSSRPPRAAAVDASGLTPAQQAALRKAREVYVGNLAPGQATADVLRELFNKALQGFVLDAAPGGSGGGEAVVDVKMDATAGRWAFVELSGEELATAAIDGLNGTELFGRALKLQRPSGYAGPQGEFDRQCREERAGGQWVYTAATKRPQTRDTALLLHTQSNTQPQHTTQQ